jgi:hypothetical protein
LSEKKFNGSVAGLGKFAFQNEQFSELAKLKANGVLFWHPVLTVNEVGRLDILMRIQCFNKNERFISLGKQSKWKEWFVLTQLYFET